MRAHLISLPISRLSSVRFYWALLVLGLIMLQSQAWAKKSSPPPERALIHSQVTEWRELNPPDASAKVIQNAEPTFPAKTWWEDFKDPHLTALIQEAILHNHELAMAEQRILQARALTRQSLGQELPQLSLNPSFTRQRNSRNLVAPSQNQFQSAGPRLFAPGSRFNLYNVPLQASYELDLFLKNRDRTRSINQQRIVSENQYQTTRVLISTDIANAYFNLICADELIRLQKNAVVLAKDSLDLEKARYEVGLSSWENVSRAEAHWAQVESELPKYEELKAVALNKIAILSGKTPVQVATLPRESMAVIFKNMDQSVLSVGIPAELLIHRPDVLAAEAELTRAKIDVRLARKAFLPDLTLSGQFGFASTSLDSLFDWQSHLTAFTASMAQSIFTGGQRHAQLKYQKSVYEEKLHHYQQTLLQAFREVEDSLAQLKATEQSKQAYLKVLQAETTTLSLTEARFEKQLVNYQAVLDSKMAVLKTQTALAQTAANYLNNRLSIYKALGGGV
ncbi:MAG: efflux transporter outer membrane subunit [Candidatus Melainabacteria bacterium]|nr:efflux transporter outer membrane subunit [Candidatus Melainabacteria bacterium]